MPDIQRNGGDDDQVDIPSTLDPKIRNSLTRIQKKLSEKSEVAKAEEEEGVISKSGVIERFDRAFPIQAGKEYPTPLTRFPIFKPIAKRHRSKHTATKEVIETGWGKIVRHGEPLTVTDEDILLAIFRLRTMKYAGDPSQLPLPLPGAGKSNVSVHLISCLVSDVLRVCEVTDTGPARKRVLDSLVRLDTVVLSFYQDKEKGKKQYRSTKLLDVAWDELEKDARLLIQIPPLVAMWLEKQYTYIDLSIRKQLCDTGKALYRFLASQVSSGRVYRVGLSVLRKVVGHDGRPAKFKSKVNETLERLVEIGWLKSFKVEVKPLKPGEPRKTAFERTIVTIYKP